MQAVPARRYTKSPRCKPAPAALDLQVCAAAKNSATPSLTFNFSACKMLCLGADPHRSDQHYGMPPAWPRPHPQGHGAIALGTPRASARWHARVPQPQSVRNHHTTGCRRHGPGRAREGTEPLAHPRLMPIGTPGYPGPQTGVTAVAPSCGTQTDPVTALADMAQLLSCHTRSQLNASCNHHRQGFLAAASKQYIATVPLHTHSPPS